MTYTNNDILWAFEAEKNINTTLVEETTNTTWMEENNILSTQHIENFTPWISEKTFHIEAEINAYKTQIFSILETNTWANIENNTATITEVWENINIPTTPSIAKKILQNFVFLIKYIGTSSAIFVILIAATNYNAYIEIARSYLNPDILEQNKNALLTSVQNTQIVSTPTTQSGETNTGIEEFTTEKTSTEKIELVKNKTYHSMDKLINTSESDINIDIEMVPYENRIVIPKLWKNIPLVDVQNKTVQNVKELENIFMNELVNGIVRYPGSARPGENGNSFIFGHSSNFPWLEWKYNDVFALIDNLSYGDEIIAYYGQKKYVYKIKEKKIIKPGDVSVLKRDNNIAEMSLMTCWPVGTTLSRMIVVAELTKE